MNALRALLLVVAALLLAACETTGGRLFTYAALGTQIEAERVVAQVYGLPGKPLPWAGIDIMAPLQRMQARQPQLRAEMTAGRLGLTDNGYLAIRDAEGKASELKTLVRAENLDRQFLYRAVSEAVGHGGLSLLAWIAYTEDQFATEWLRQAPIGWWSLDTERGWRQKTVENAAPVGK